MLAHVFLIATVSLILASPFIWIGWEIWNAPEGYQDETGFHYGKRKQDAPQSDDRH